MKRRRYREQQMAFTRRQHETRASDSEIVRKMEIPDLRINREPTLLGIVGCLRHKVRSAGRCLMPTCRIGDCHSKAKQMKRFLALIVLLLAGCGETEQDAIKRIKDEDKSSGTITDQQAETLSKSRMLNLGSLTSITDKQAESLSEIDYHLGLGGLTSISDEQAESLSRV